MSFDQREGATMIRRLVSQAVMATAAVLFVFSIADQRADPVFVEPDLMGEGADLTSAFPGVVLTVEGLPDTIVRARDGFSVFNNRNLATTFDLVFAQDPQRDPPFVPLTWDYTHGVLKAEFAVPTDFVEIDMICDDDDIAELRAFDAGGLPLETVNIGCDGEDGVTLPLFVTATIVRNTPDVAYIEAGGTGEPLLLDNLKFNLLTPVCDVQLGDDVYMHGDKLTAQIFRISHTGNEPVDVEVKTWLALAGTEPMPINALKKQSTMTLQPGFDKDFGPVRLGTVKPGFPSGLADFVCRLIDPATGNHFDLDIDQFEIQ